MKRIISFWAAVLLTSAGMASETAESTVLIREKVEALQDLLGDWEGESQIHKTAVRESAEIASQFSVRKELDGAYLQIDSVGEFQGISYVDRWLISYDLGSKNYRAWNFSSLGFHSSFTGEYDPDAKTMTWRLEENYVGTTGTSLWRITKSEFSLDTTIYSSDGELYNKITGKYSRRDKAGKNDRE